MQRTSVRRLALVLAVSLLTVVMPTMTATSASAAKAARPYCGITWGSQARGVDGIPTDSKVLGVRTGRHACFDRVVVDVLGPITSWNANYPLSGNSETTLVIVFGAQPTAVPFTYTAYPTPGYRTVRDLAVSVQPSVPWNVLYIGTRSRLPYRVFTLAGAQPGQTRLVVDVAHRW